VGKIGDEDAIVGEPLVIGLPEPMDGGIAVKRPGVVL
jgi:hypothetical protein